MKDPFYDWDVDPMDKPKRPRIPRDDGDEATLLVFVVVAALVPLLTGLIIWVMR